MKYIALFLLTLALFVLGLGLIAAQDTPLPNDPNVNPDANACFEGGSMEGKCGDSEYLWIGGWYKIRFEYGLISRDIFPSLYDWELPNIEETFFGGIPTCTIDIGSANATVLILTSSMIQVPLAVINGQSDPNATPGVSPYGFDWYVDPILAQLTLFTPSTAQSMTLWSNMGGWNAGIVSNTCPGPTSP